MMSFRTEAVIWAHFSTKEILLTVRDSMSHSESELCLCEQRGHWCFSADFRNRLRLFLSSSQVHQREAADRSAHDRPVEQSRQVFLFLHLHVLQEIWFFPEQLLTRVVKVNRNPSHHISAAVQPNRFGEAVKKFFAAPGVCVDHWVKISAAHKLAAGGGASRLVHPGLWNHHLMSSYVLQLHVNTPQTVAWVRCRLIYPPTHCVSLGSSVC